MSLQVIPASKSIRLSYLLMALCWVTSPVHLFVRIGSDVHTVLFLGCGAAMIYSLLVAVFVQPRDFIPPLAIFLAGVLHGALTPVA
ncbi:MAG: hypothetical protein V9H26_00070 [Verrucomicrobiota bacterium]|nr:hypothetical protein [Verrucomicrobiota bacterium]MCC6822686.1 hypothetical protein [Limisphaerales bacterium]